MRHRGGAANIALAHDYLTQRGGAERVVLAMLRAFPGSPLHTSLFDPASTYPDFREVDVRPLPINRLRVLRDDHRRALPVLAPAFSARRIDADVVVCSSSGWAHGVRTTGRKVVYCYSPAKWLHQPDRYAVNGAAARATMRLLRAPLLRWDRHAAATADRYLVTSTAVRDWVQEAYGIEAEVVPPPGGVDAAGPVEPVVGLPDRFMLCVSRLLPYKHVDAVVDGIGPRRDIGLVVVGDGPEARTLAARPFGNVVLVPKVSDAQLRWLYRSCAGLVTAAEEDYGLTPIEAGSFGKPVVALRWGGFLDTVVEGETGVFIEEPTPEAVAAATAALLAQRWDPGRIAAHAATFSEMAFIERLRSIVAEEHALA